MMLVNLDSAGRRRGVRSEFLHSILGHKHLGAPGFVLLQGIGEHARPPAPAPPQVKFRGDPFFGDDDPNDPNERPSP
jgi:hypothetical protein